MKMPTSNVQNVIGRLTILEWMIVLSIPSIIIGSIRSLAMFQIGLVIMAVLAAYSLLASIDYLRFRKIKKANKRKKVSVKLHYIQTIQYGLLALLVAFIYLTF